MKPEEKKLLKLSRKLKLYAHNNNTSCEIDRCPGVCECIHKLDLDTAIAWRTGTVIHFIIKYDDSQCLSVQGEKEYPHYYYRNIVSLKNSINSYKVISFLHSNKYKKLYDMLLEAFKLCNELIEKYEEEHDD